MNILSTKLKPNIYTYCLKKGYETTSTGITYNQIKDELTYMFRIEWEPHFELNFRIWFFDNFFEQVSHRILDSVGRRSQIQINTSTGRIPFEELINKKVFLKGESCLKFLDYMELVDARRSSKQAFIFSLISIIIATIAIIVQIKIG